MYITKFDKKNGNKGRVWRSVMVYLITVPILIAVLGIMLEPNTRKENRKIFMILSSIILVLIMGLRTQYTGSKDTQIYFRLCESVSQNVDIRQFLGKLDLGEGNILFSEVGFYVYVWLIGRVFPHAQWLLIITSLIIVICVAKFIWNNSKDFCISWLVFVCLGSMTFAMNGMRQSIAMGICLLADEYAKRRKIIPFLILVLLAMLFHKSALFFVIVYGFRGMKFGVKSMLILGGASLSFIVFANQLSALYDNIMGEDYYGAESFEGGSVTFLIYLIAIVMALLTYKSLKDNLTFAMFAMSIVGATIYFGRYTSNQMYERMSYYFFFYLILLFPSVMSSLKTRDKQLLSVLFTILAIALFSYRISKGAFSNYELFW